jgi:hypothetical protein
MPNGQVSKHASARLASRAVGDGKSPRLPLAPPGRRGLGPRHQIAKALLLRTFELTKGGNDSA